MAAKTIFHTPDFTQILSQYDLGSQHHARAIQHGTVQTNYVLETSQGKFVFRYYENRSYESVHFECDLLAYLIQNQYPCPKPRKNQQGDAIGQYKQKPYIIFDFIEGQHIETPQAHHTQQLIEKAAHLQTLTTNFQSPYTPHRWHYTPVQCLTLAQKKATQLGHGNAQRKLDWLTNQIAHLQFPNNHPTGVCHCDFHFSNVLFQNDQFAALLDFDDANITYLQFDLVGLIEYNAWHHTQSYLDIQKARQVVQMYMQYRPLSSLEQQHLFDVYKLSILFDCIWYFERGSAHDFYEKQKIESLSKIGRQAFMEQLF